MARMTATLVLGVDDNSSLKLNAITKSLTRLQKAERDMEMAQRGARLSRTQRAHELILLEQEREAELRKARTVAFLKNSLIGAAAVGYVATKTYKDFANLEDRIAGIVINADEGVEKIGTTISRLQQIANKTKISFEDATGGLEGLVAAGRGLDDALAFLPSIALTAKATGASTADLATTADALAGSFKVTAAEMQKAFDILAVEGKLGKFELKDMAQYVSGLAPSFAKLGYTGLDATVKLAAMFQTVRKQTGDAASAATQLQNVFLKLNSPETLKNFSKFGIDIEKEFAKGKADGKDMVDVLLDMTMIATKGDLNQLGKLFNDQELRLGISALIDGRIEYEKFVEAGKRADGTVLVDFAKKADLAAAKIQVLSNNWDRFVKNIGRGVATVANPALESFNQLIDDMDAKTRATEGQDPKLVASDREKFMDRFYREHGGRNRATGPAALKAYNEALIKVGNGEAKTVLDGFYEKDRRSALLDDIIAGKGEASIGPYSNKKPYVAGPGMVPVPGSRPTQSNPYDWHGYRPAKSEEPQPYDLRRERHRRNRAALANADPASLGMNPDTGPKSVTITGTPMMTLTNPPQPAVFNISVSTTVNEAKNGAQIARDIGANIKTAVEGLHAGMGHR